MYIFKWLGPKLCLLGLLVLQFTLKLILPAWGVSLNELFEEEVVEEDVDADTGGRGGSGGGIVDNLSNEELLIGVFVLLKGYGELLWEVEEFPIELWEVIFWFDKKIDWDVDVDDDDEHEDIDEVVDVEVEVVTRDSNEEDEVEVVNVDTVVFETDILEDTIDIFVVVVVAELLLDDKSFQTVFEVSKASERGPLAILTRYWESSGKYKKLQSFLCIELTRAMATPDTEKSWEGTISYSEEVEDSEDVESVCNKVGGESEDIGDEKVGGEIEVPLGDVGGEFEDPTVAGGNINSFSNPVEKDRVRWFEIKDFIRDEEIAVLRGNGDRGDLGEDGIVFKIQFNEGLFRWCLKSISSTILFNWNSTFLIL